MKIEKEFTGKDALKDALLYSYAVKSLKEFETQGLERRVADVPTERVLVFQFKGYNYKHIYVVTNAGYVLRFSPFCSVLSGSNTFKVAIRNGELVKDAFGEYETKEYVGA